MRQLLAGDTSVLADPEDIPGCDFPLATTARSSPSVRALVRARRCAPLIRRSSGSAILRQISPGREPTTRAYLQFQAVNKQADSSYSELRKLCQTCTTIEYRGRRIGRAGPGTLTFSDPFSFFPGEDGRGALPILTATGREGGEDG